jgi:hypothetical protein
MPLTPLASKSPKSLKSPKSGSTSGNGVIWVEASSINERACWQKRSCFVAAAEGRERGCECRGRRLDIAVCEEVVVSINYYMLLHR